MPHSSRPVAGFVPTRRARSDRISRIGRFWRKANLGLQALDDRSVPSATATIDAPAVLSPDAPMIVANSVRRELVIIDSRVSDYQSIIRDIQDNQSYARRIEIAVLRPEVDGLDQIAKLLRDYRELNAVHFISHGNNNGLQLGNTWLNADMLTGHGDQIRDWAKSLKVGADVLFYGCDLAGGADGRRLLQGIRGLTGADVSASTDRTGAKSLGGNWQLEYRAGRIETVLAPSPTFQQSYVGALATFVVASTALGASDKDVVLIDSRLPDSDILAKAVLPDSKLFVYDGLKDSAHDVLTQVTSWANSLDLHISSLSILAHGTSGAFELGNQWISSASLPQTSADWLELKHVLVAGANIELFGCDVVAPGSDGQSLINLIGQLTGADVFASTNLTGQGGDWRLEAASTGAEAELAAGLKIPLNVQMLDTYGRTLAASFTGSYRQDFNVLGTTGTTMPAEYSAMSLGGNNGTYTAASPITTAAIAKAKQTSNQVLTVWNPGDPNTYSQTQLANAGRIGGLNPNPDRALGTGPTLVGAMVIELALTNNTGGSLSSILLGYDMLVLANGSAGTEAGELPGYSFFYNTTGGKTAADWTAVAALSLANTIVGDVAHAETTITFGSALADGSTMYFRWADDNNVANAPDQNFAIDNVVINDAPALDNTKSPALTAINEDAGAPVGAVGTLVNQLVDFAVPAGQLDNVIDPDAGALLGIALTGTDETNGRWWFSLDNGATWYLCFSVSDTNALLLSADAVTRLYFQPRSDYFGTMSPAITFRAWDQTNGATGGNVDASVNGGTTAFSAAAGTASLVVVGVPDAPKAVDDRLALNFDGTDDYVQIGSFANLVVTNTVTMEAWINPNGFSGNTRIILNKEGEYEMALYPGNTLAWAFTNTDPGWNWHDTGVQIPLGAWTHVAVSYNNGVVTAYVNGVAVDVYNGSGTIGDTYPLLNDLRIGGRSNNPAGQYFDGRIADIRVWNTARTGVEISANINGPLTGAETGLIGYWRFDEGTGGVVFDRSPSGHNGALTTETSGSPTWYGYRIVEGGSLTATAPGVLGNDYDGDGDPLTAFLVSGPSFASSFVFNPDGSFTYTPAANFYGTDSFTYFAFDGVSNSNIATVFIVVDPVNDPPVNTVPVAKYTSYNTALAFKLASGNAISISDPDAGGNAVQVSLNVGNGSLTLSGVAGLTITSGANGTGSMTIVGSMAAINAALDGMAYTANLNYRGLDNLTIVTNDLGNVGAGGAMIDSDSFKIYVGALVVTNANDVFNGDTTSVQTLIANDGGDGISLREAIYATNATAGADYIMFDIPGAGVHTIQPTNGLPTIADAVVIDGSTQPGYAGTPLIEIDGKFSGPFVNGFLISAAGTTIRGLAIFRFSSDGIKLSGAAANNNFIQANYIGTNAVQSAGLGNGGHGVFITGAFSNTIGGTTAGTGNLITANLGDGIAIVGGANDLILGNAIFANSGLGIDLNDDGVTPNDPGDPDAGGNDLKNFPVLSLVASLGANTYFSGTYNSFANRTYRIEFFSNLAGQGDPTGYGEGQTYLGFVNIVTDASGNANFGIVLPVALAPGTVITATATDLTLNDTSEFAANVPVTMPRIAVTPTSGLTTTEAGGTAAFSVVLTAPPSTNVTVTISSSNVAEGTVSISSLTFTTANWNTPQTVTITGMNDFVADGNQPYTIVLGAATSADPNYNGVDPTDVSVTNTDNDSVGIVVTPTSGLTTTEAGGKATFSVVLISQPTGTVTFNVTSSNPAEGTVSVSSLTFDAMNWNVPQTVTITGIDDFVDDGDQPYTIVFGTSVSSDPNYNGINMSGVSVTNTDDDTAGIFVTPTFGLTTTEAGGKATFAVQLTSQPTGTVVIPISSGNLAEGTLSVSSLTFDNTNWSTPQTVTITGVDDFVVDGDQNYAIVLGMVSSTDAKYNGYDPADFTATNKDNDIAGIVVSPTSGLVTTEASGKATFTVVLTSQPTGTVTINVTSSNPAEGTASVGVLTFDGTNWNLPQTVTITGVDDFIADGNVGYTIVLSPAISSDPNYNNVDPADVGVTNTDDDLAGIIVSPITGLVTTEAGGKATFNVVLMSRPTGTVTINVTSSNPAEGIASVSSLTFDSANWNVAQIVTITGVDDFVADGNIGYTIVLSPAVSGDPNYNGVDPTDVSVTNLDNETPGIFVTPTSGLTTTEAGGKATFGVVLTSQPTGTVTINVSSSNPAEGTASVGVLTFDGTNWNLPQTITITGVDDFIADGNINYTIVLDPAVSGDPNYNGIDPTDVSVANIDNDAAGIVVTPTSGLTTTEAGGKTTFTIVLTSQPTALVTINVASNNVGEGTVNTGVLTFDATNWNIAQVITITSVNEFIDDGDQLFTIVNNAATSGDTKYNAVDPNDVTVTNIDDDTAGITVTPIVGLTITEAGGKATYTVILTSQPTAVVTINVGSGNGAEGTVSNGVLTFDATNWNFAQTVTITGVNEFIDDGDQLFTIVNNAATSGDTKYNAVDPNDVTVTNIDDDTAGIVVTPTKGLSTTEAGGTATFKVVLTSQPTANVTIAVNSNNVAEGTISVPSLTFNAANWNVPQVVTITGVDDSFDDGDVALNIATGAAASFDGKYSSQDAADIAVDNLDNDTAGIRVIGGGQLLVDNNGTTATFTLSLTSQPYGTVAVRITPRIANALSFDPTIVYFSGSDWARGVPVTLKNVIGNRAVGDLVVSIDMVASSFDLGYEGQTATVDATNRTLASKLIVPPPPPPPFVPPVTTPINQPNGPNGVPTPSGGNDPRSPDGTSKQLPSGGGRSGETFEFAPASDGSSAVPVVEIIKTEKMLVDHSAPIPTSEIITAYKPVYVPITSAHFSVQQGQFDQVTEEITNEKSARAASARLALGTVVIASAGCVLWSLRGAAWLLSAVASSTPSWTVFDPMTLLAARPKRRDEHDDETLADLTEAANKI